MIVIRELLGQVKPSGEEVTSLAIEETDPKRIAKSGAIAHGPLFEILALASMPSRVFRGAFQPRPSGE